MSDNYQRKKKWRKKYPEKRAAERKKNYEKGRKFDKNTRASWTSEHEGMITAADRLPDRELAKNLGRSVQAIQVRRTRVLALQG